MISDKKCRVINCNFFYLNIEIRKLCKFVGFLFGLLILFLFAYKMLTENINIDGVLEDRCNDQIWSWI